MEKKASRNLFLKDGLSKSKAWKASRSLNNHCMLS